VPGVELKVEPGGLLDSTDAKIFENSLMRGHQIRLTSLWRMQTRAKMQIPWKIMQACFHSNR